MYEVTLAKAVRYKTKRYEATDKITVDEETLEELQRHEACAEVTEIQAKTQRKPRKPAAEADTESGE